jgi:CrcB protein
MPNPFAISLLVGFAGFAGSIARYGLSVTSQRFSFEWPLGTLAANVLGCFVIGVITELSARGEAIPPAARLALATGFCGGFTTTSSLVYETAEMLRAHEVIHATTYAAGTFLLSMTTFAAGILKQGSMPGCEAAFSALRLLISISDRGR